MRHIAGYILALSILGCAKGDVERNINVHSSWARVSAKGQSTAIYFTVESTFEDTLYEVLVDTSISENVSIHITKEEDGVMRMEHVPYVVIPKGKLEFKPGGYHIMLMSLKRDLKPGDSIAFTLKFKKHGEVHATAIVR